MPVNSLEKKIAADVEKKLRTRMGIPDSQPLPANLKAIVDKTAKDMELSASERFVKKEAMLLGKQYFREVTPQTAIASRLSNALKGVQMVSGSSDLQKMIEENAKMLFAKKTALETAGFTAAEAFQLILAEVSAKKSR